MASDLPRGVLTLGEVAEIKQELWEGVARQRDIAEAYHITQPTVSRIARGEQWPDVPWPDGSTGPINPQRRTAIMRDRRLVLAQSHARASTAATEQVLSAAERVAERLSAQAEAADTEYAASLKVSKARRPQGDETVTSKLSWASIVRDAPDSLVVTECKKDAPLRRAAGVVCATLAQGEWDNPETMAIIRNLAKQQENKV